VHEAMEAPHPRRPRRPLRRTARLRAGQMSALPRCAAADSSPSPLERG
jgi:hypothetical protein